MTSPSPLSTLGADDGDGEGVAKIYFWISAKHKIGCYHTHKHTQICTNAVLFR